MESTRASVTIFSAPPWINSLSCMRLQLRVCVIVLVISLYLLIIRNSYVSVFKPSKLILLQPKNLFIKNITLFNIYELPPSKRYSQFIQQSENMIKQYDYLFKIVLIGNSSVGKSSLLRRFTEESFQETYLATIGVDFRFKSIIIEGEVVKFQIWDTAGQQRFRTITGTYYKGAQGIVIVYDITKKDSFQELQTYWLKQIQKNAIPNVQLILLGNKNDLQEERQVKKEDIAELCKSRGIQYLQVSAKSGDNVGKAFERMAELLMKIYPKQDQKSEPMAVVEDIRRKRRQFQLQAGNRDVKKSKGCC